MSKWNSRTEKKEDVYTLPKKNTGIPNYKRFQKVLKMTQEELKNYLIGYLSTYGYKVVKGDGYIFAKGDVDILLTAHIDTTPNVGGAKRIPPKVIHTSSNGIVSSPQGIGGDDRCGVYIITEVIKETKCSVLFCEDEEIGCVGSYKFAKSKHLKKIKDMRYMIEVDRKGKDDLVFYDCNNIDFEDYLLDNLPDYNTNWGTCSDISVLMEESGVAGVNISCGYYNEHTLNETINLKEMEHTLESIKGLVKLDSPFFEYIDAYEDWDFKSYNYGYSYNSYSSGYSSNKKHNDFILYVTFREKEAEKDAISYGYSFESAFFHFFEDNPDICYNDIVDYYTETDLYGEAYQ